MSRRTARRSCGCASAPRPLARSRAVRSRWSGPGDRPALSAGCHSKRQATSARGRMATGLGVAEAAEGRSPIPEQPDLAEAASLDLLESGVIEVQGRLVDASNATLYCTVRGNGRQAVCVYKPVAGERPLWDFPDGTLAGREVAAYMVSRAAGWDVVPPTIYRDGPFGPGMCQLWIDADDSVDVVELARSSSDPRLRQMAVFDAVINNA